jgi:hypothetical protein
MFTKVLRTNENAVTAKPKSTRDTLDSIRTITTDPGFTPDRMDLPELPEKENNQADLITYVPSTCDNDQVYTAYKRVDKKVKPVPTSFPEDCYVERHIPEDPLLTLPLLSCHPPPFEPTRKISKERMEILDVNGSGFLWPEEEKLFKHIMKLNEEAIAFEDTERGTFKESYFAPYIIPTVSHHPWEYKHTPMPLTE